MDRVTCFSAPLSRPAIGYHSRQRFISPLRMDAVSESAKPDPKNEESNSENAPQRTYSAKPQGVPPKTSASWSKIGMEGFDHKGTGSALQWDLRPAKFRTKEEGAGLCDLCRGTGKAPCSFCNGRDYIGPNGQVVGCNACKGARVTTCSTCYGSGKHLDIEGNWFLRDFSKILTRD